eukprot:CAMPEP_0194499420 /NCGR_PEP_ID=MMETSP0253-20130528/15734_1 /TAXON_ID=2966 /ORGANISM="Noctiluca scintillans" /LENGTH=211 /DNA_ID=CAMNT_0039341169 /DNA_START=76 /DNA_END=711 /DNA_ORIENTATION=+
MARVVFGLLACTGVSASASDPNRCVENVEDTSKLTASSGYSVHHTCSHFIGVDSMRFQEDSHMVSTKKGCRWEAAYAGVNEGRLGTPFVVESCSPNENIHDWKVWDYFTEGLTEPYRVISSDEHWVHGGLNYAVKGNFTFIVGGMEYDCGTMHYGQGNHDLWDYNGFFGGDSCTFHTGGNALECCNGLLFQPAGHQNANNRYQVSVMEFQI